MSQSLANGDKHISAHHQLKVVNVICFGTPAKLKRTPTGKAICEMNINVTEWVHFIM